MFFKNVMSTGGNSGNVRGSQMEMLQLRGRMNGLSTVWWLNDIIHAE